ncbi:putative late blight resistance protein homolog R1A-3 isoform X2 [Solanum stenotomum]|uniref:putative late blight resistance protein homolog R1A-3 isoform X2 n=1 Tax=Solanum stenotomum TaxID=172797 RepID=UPI0020CFED85|nr:putative late blight resistance protein homolog R1A-3 isoform X2 [Solanum stenotomum]
MSPDKDHLLEALQQFIDQWNSDMPETSKERIRFLKRDFEFLHIFLTFTDLSDMPDVTYKVQALFQDAVEDLKKVNKIHHIDRVTSRIQEKIRITKLEIRDINLVLSNKDGNDTPKFVIEFIDTVIKNLADFVELGVIFKELKLLRNFVCFVSGRSMEPKCLHSFLTHVLLVVGRAAMIVWLYWNFPSNNSKNQEMNDLFCDLLNMKVKPIQSGIRKIYIDVLQAVTHPIIQIENAADCIAGFMETLQHNLKELPTPSRMDVVLTDQILVLEEMFDLLLDKLRCLSVQVFEFHLQDIDTVVVDSGLLVYSLYEDVSLEEKTSKLEDTIERIKTLIYHIIRKEFQSSLPTIHGIGYVDFLLSNLEKFHDLYSDPRADFTAQLRVIQTELESLQPFIRSVALERHNKYSKLERSVALLIGKVYEVEYIVNACISNKEVEHIVDACISNKVPNWCLMPWLLDLIKEIGAEIQSLADDSVSHGTIDTDTSCTPSRLARTQSIEDEIVDFDDEIVGFEDEIRKIREQLIRGSDERDIISIVGMSGAGKTALANRLYSDESVVARFDIRARCYVSSVYSRRKLLLSILKLLRVNNNVTTPLSEKTSGELADVLRRILLRRRYLILIDDVPNDKVWEDLKPTFCDDKNGSRILLTTQYYNVANDARLNTEPLRLRRLNDGESWTLLKKKVFGEGDCFDALEKVGRKIVQKCEGLPLAIVCVASILARKERTEQCWKQVVRSLDEEEINISKLTLLWIGEGFVKDDEHRTLEDIAEGYLKNLVESNLVMLAKRSCGGRVKVCPIHDSLFQFCKERAHTENLIQRIQRSEGDAYFPNQLGQRRLAFYAEVGDLVEWRSSCSLVSSVLFRKANTNESSSITKAKASKMFHDFRFLKVLDLEFTVIDSFPTDMIYLRYLAAQTSHGSITSSFDKLWNLETLIVNGMRGHLSVPPTIWKMVKLRHLHISPTFTAEQLPEDSSELNDLVTFSTPYFSCVEDAELMLRKTPNIRELKCKFEGLSSGQFPVLDFPTQLEVLDIFGDEHVESLPYLVRISASNLKKLKVSYYILGSQHLSNISQLQNLEELELNFVEFEGEKWEVMSDEFAELKVLKIVNCSSFREWTVYDDAFSNLEHMVLRCCQLPVEIPPWFAEIDSLKYIEVDNCNGSVVDSARSIQNTKDEDYDVDLELVIKNHNSDE